MKRFLAVLLAFTLSGCLTYDSYGYRDDGYYEDRYYSGGRHYDNGPGYGAGYGYGYGNYPDYVYWSDYYSVLWPVYRSYYDPFYTPGFYYGVTWYPHTYFGLNHYWNSWPYYHAYSPYRYSYSDGYFDHWDRRRGQVGHRVAHGYSANVNHPYLYGSARNEAEQLARRTGAGYQRSGAQPGVQYDPYAAQRTSPLARESDSRGAQSEGRYRNSNISNDPRGRDTIRRSDGDFRQRDPATYPSGQSVPSRARTYDRGEPTREQAQNPGVRSSGWVSERPPEQTQGFAQPAARGRPGPYYRDVGGAQIPINRQPPLDSGVERSIQQRREVVEYQRVSPTQSGEQRAGRERQQPYTYQQSAPSYQQVERSESSRYQSSSEQRQAPSRQSAPQYDAPSPSYEQPSRSAEPQRSQPERGESSGRESAREESRRSRDED